MDEDALFAEFLGEIKSVAVTSSTADGDGGKDNDNDDAASVGENEDAAAAAATAAAGNGEDTNKRKGDVVPVSLIVRSLRRNHLVVLPLDASNCAANHARRGKTDRPGSNHNSAQVKINEVHCLHHPENAVQCVPLRGTGKL